jgi:hypothetical protein
LANVIHHSGSGCLQVVGTGASWTNKFVSFAAATASEFNLLELSHGIIEGKITF